MHTRVDAYLLLFHTHVCMHTCSQPKWPCSSFETGIYTHSFTYSTHTYACIPALSRSDYFISLKTGIYTHILYTYSTHTHTHMHAYLLSFLKLACTHIHTYTYSTHINACISAFSNYIPSLKLACAHTYTQHMYHAHKYCCSAKINAQAYLPSQAWDRRPAKYHLWWFTV